MKRAQRGERVPSILASACLLAAAAATGTVACKKQQAQSFERPPAAVTVAQAVAKDVPVYLDEVGKCVSREVVSVMPQIAGKITELHFTDGADVKKGDPLFTIDPRPFEAALHSAEADLGRAKALLNFSKSQWNRVETLIQTKAVSQEEYDTRRNAVELAQEQVRQGQAAVETARLNLDYCSIRSPIDGRTGHRLVDIGNVVKANETPLLMIERLDPIYTDFTIPQGQLTAVQKNMNAGSLKVEVRLPDETDKPIAGTLTFLDNAVADATGTVKLRATLGNADHRLWPGRFVRVRLLLSTLPGAILVPAVAPQLSAKGSFVYVVKPDSTAEMRAVKTGQRQGDSIVIEDGVKAGEKVVVTGQLGVTPGGKVREVSAEGAAAPAVAGSGGKS
ncbi:MAG TPA: efflux RND transporter periplasmic adaptor subunit [Thermoanaerobaculia bacterium]|nr:efflux RND transporter periplasmic adaptor subunit [Thermoanaerobaculia bacterium]